MAEVKHPDWCAQNDRCTVTPDGTVTHTHLVGRIAELDINVVVERTDGTDDAGKPKHSPTRAFAYVGGVKLTTTQGRRLNNLLGRASAFSGGSGGGIGGAL